MARKMKPRRNVEYDLESSIKERLLGSPFNLHKIKPLVPH
jgi:hypothetical protein